MIFKVAIAISLDWVKKVLKKIYCIINYDWQSPSRSQDAFRRLVKVLIFKDKR